MQKAEDEDSMSIDSNEAPGMMNDEYFYEDGQNKKDEQQLAHEDMLKMQQ
jgi:hypothetical protein